MSVKTELKLAYLKDTKNLIKNAIIEKGQDVSDSDTFRSYADKILAIAGGGSGEGGIDLEGLPVIFPDTELTAVAEFDGVAPVMEPFDLAAGDLCLVNWNGTGYLCKAKPVNFNGLPIVGIGNTIALGGENTGEPFAVGCIPAELTIHTNGAYGLVAPVDGSTTFKLGIYKIKTILEDLPIAVDFTNGNQTISAPDGYLVESAIIQKPANLVPENIMSGVDIAGIVGTAVAGGGGTLGKKLWINQSTLPTKNSDTDTRLTGVSVCPPEVKDPIFIYIYAYANKPKPQTTTSDRRCIAAWALNTKDYGRFFTNWSGYEGEPKTRSIAYAEGQFGIGWSSSTPTGMHDPIDTTGLTGDAALMHQGDIYFYRKSDGFGYIDVGLPFNSANNATWKWLATTSYYVLVVAEPAE